MVPPPADEEYIATAIFSLCHKPEQPAITYKLSLSTCPLQTELNILSQLGENGRTFFTAFHEERESCVFARPLDDLINIWHAQKVEGCIFCLHLHGRERKVRDADLKVHEDAWVKGKEVVGVQVDERVMNGRGPKRGERRAVEPAEQQMEVEQQQPDSVNFTLTFSYQESPLMSAGLWQPINTTVELGLRLDALPRLIAIEMQNMVKQDEELLAALQASGELLEFHIALGLDDPRDAYADFDDGKVLVETIGDLLSDPLDKEQTIGISVGIVVTDGNESSARKGRQVVPYRPQVAQMFRLGSVKEHKPKQTDADKVAMGSAIVGALDDATGLRLGAVSVWYINGLCIGDCYAGNGLDFKQTCAWSKKYRAAKSIYELGALVHSHRCDEPSEAAEALPVLPKYCFRPFHSQEIGLGSKSLTTVGIQVAVRAVNMMPDCPWLVLPAPRRLLFELASNDTVKVLSGLIRGKMTGAGSDGRTSARLFQEEMTGTWEMWIWVLPQVEGSATMYRWLDGAGTQFLRSERGREDRRLYVEAHIVPAVGGGPSSSR